MTLVCKICWYSSCDTQHQRCVLPQGRDQGRDGNQCYSSDQGLATAFLQSGCLAPLLLASLAPWEGGWDFILPNTPGQPQSPWHQPGTSRPGGSMRCWHWESSSFKHCLNFGANFGKTPLRWQEKQQHTMCCGVRSGFSLWRTGFRLFRLL